MAKPGMTESGRCPHGVPLLLQCDDCERPTSPVTESGSQSPLFNWVVQAAYRGASVLLWVTGCATPEEAQQKAREQSLAFGVEFAQSFEYGANVTISEPVNMGSD